MQKICPEGVSLIDAILSVKETIKLVGDLPGITTAARFYKERNKQIKPKRVAEVVAELINVKESRGASARYLQDLRYRLNQFALAFECNIRNVTVPAAQTCGWITLKLSTQSYMNFHRVIFLLFKHAVTRGYALDNPIKDVEPVKICNGAIEIYKPAEIEKYLTSAGKDFLPCIAMGAFAGLRSAEITRLEWDDIHFSESFIEVSVAKSKTASRRVVPISDNLAQWLAPYAGRRGMVWTGSPDGFYKQMSFLAKSVGIDWKQNALRHSFLQLSARHYPKCSSKSLTKLAIVRRLLTNIIRELVKPADAVKWFSISPSAPENVVSMPSTASH